MKQANPGSDGQASQVGVLQRVAARLLLEINGVFFLDQKLAQEVKYALSGDIK